MTAVIELYVYYKVADAAAARAVLAGWPAVTVLRRSDDSGPHETWMEIHRGPDAAAVEQALAQALQAHLAGPRHVERFTPLLTAI